MNDLTSIHNMNLMEMQSQIEKLEEIKKQWQIEHQRECELELRYAVFTEMENKGEAILCSIRETLTSRKIGSNLRNYLISTNMRLQDIKSLNRQLPGLVAGFQAYWLTKTKKDKKLSDAIESKEGTSSLMNYIGSEILVERFKMDDLKSTEAAARVAMGLIKRNSRSYNHEALAVARREILQDQIDYAESYGALIGGAYLENLSNVIYGAISKALINSAKQSESDQRAVASNTKKLYQHKNNAIGFDRGEG